MARIGLIALTVWLWLAMPVLAGAWMREEGTGFFSSSIEHDGKEQGNASTYLEFGARPDLTVGADLSIELFPESTSTSYAGFFLRRPLGNAEGTHRWAWRLGAGVAWDMEVTQPYLETGLHWGRGIELWQRYGWAAIDGTIKWETMTGDQIVKLDSTLGLGVSERLKGMMQLFLEYDQETTVTKVAPSVLWEPEGFGGFTFQFGAVIESGAEDRPTLKLGIWREF
ncbi:hypothetical protein [Sulfitobacter sp. D35]|uniref:hypothetical protein n=1 Tax=Sulfitobacter sp. D35 TaxID=3083252 RepID=UPI00296F879E|nr:hypothetical protein [Sulfitobacter sp. D35]